MQSTDTSLQKLSLYLSFAFFGLVTTTSVTTVEAQDDPTYIDEVVVQAQRRDQSLSDVPVSVSVLTGTAIEASGIKDMFDMQQNVPA